MATALTPQADVTSGKVTDGEPETVVSLGQPTESKID